jgi:hypothetical protein
MPDAPDSKTRAARLREQIAARRNRDADDEITRPGEDDGPKPGESPNAYVERRMRETLKKKE